LIFEHQSGLCHILISIWQHTDAQMLLHRTI
jgi:hypothetical protein